VPAKKLVAAKPAVPMLKNMADSMSYAIGVNIAQSIYKDFADLNMDVFYKRHENGGKQTETNIG